jgi:hypothetical protein
MQQTAVLAYDTVDDREPEPGAPPRLLRREERFEDAVQDLESHALSGVADRDLHVLAGPSPRVHRNVGLVHLDVARLDAGRSCA